jgi:radical SAM superfamily enzyme YgiQ (UPF0313 family)
MNRGNLGILLLRPPATYPPGAARPSVSLPVGLLYVAAVLEKCGHAVEILDAQVHLAAPVSRDTEGRVHLGLPWEEFKSRVKARKPDIVGITSLFTSQLENVLRAAEIARKAAPRALIVVGGNHPTVRPDDFFSKTDAVDIACMGEGEYTMREIADAARVGGDVSRIPGTAVRETGGMRVNPARPPIGNLDELPLPAYHLVRMEDYFLLHAKGFTDRPVAAFRGANRAVSVITSRGCPFNCVFCSIHLHMGRKWRAHSVGYVLNHLDHLVSKYGVTHVHFEDDNLSASPRRFRELLEGFVHAGNRFTWDTPNGVRVDTLTKEIVDDCVRSGCVYLIFGVESGNQTVLNELVDKKLDLAAVERAASWCKGAGLDAMSFFVIGFPGETRRDMLDTVDFALGLQRNYDVNPGLFVATPLPGTRLEKIFLERGLMEGALTPEALSKMTQGASVMDGGTFTADDIREMREAFLNGYRKNFARNFASYVARNPLSVPALLRGVLAARTRKRWSEALLDVFLCKNFIGGRGRTAAR